VQRQALQLTWGPVAALHGGLAARRAGHGCCARGASRHSSVTLRRVGGVLGRVDRQQKGFICRRTLLFDVCGGGVRRAGCLAVVVESSMCWREVVRSWADCLWRNAGQRDVDYTGG
jgi:hypothetical protein